LRCVSFVIRTPVSKKSKKMSEERRKKDLKKRSENNSKVGAMLRVV